MRYLSVCSGIESATVAWHPLGWSPVAFSEIEPFPSAVLAHHYPDVPNRGDMTRFEDWPDGHVDVLVGGTPCQAFSVAGLRAGLADPRGNLTLTYLAIADRYRPEWLVFENVPGAFSSTSHLSPDLCPPDIDLDSDDGPRDGEEVVVADEYEADEDHAFSCFLAGLQELGYGFAYRALDARYFGLAQRRSRLFVVANLGDWRRAAAVLFERESLSGHPAPRGEAGARAAGALGTGASSGGGWRVGADEAAAGQIVPVAYGIAMRGRDGISQPELTEEIAPALMTAQGSHSKAYVHQAVAYGGNDTRGPIDVHTALSACHTASGRQDFESETLLVQEPPCIAFDTRQNEAFVYGGQAGSLDCQQPVQGVTTRYGVRRITPVEAERLQGFPDGYTAITYRGKPAADGPRYRAIGNSMPVPVMAWIGRRIEMVNALLADRSAA